MIRCNTLIIEVALLGDFFCGWMWGHGLLHSAYLAARLGWGGAIRARLRFAPAYPHGRRPDAPWVILLCKGCVKNVACIFNVLYVHGQ